MRNNQLTLLALIAVLGTAYAAVEYDLIKGVDMTGRSSIPPSSLNQLVDNATVQTNKGMVIIQGTTPDVTLNPRYSRYLWIDNSVPATPTLKAYNGSSWTNALSGTTITSANLADGSVTTAKLGSGAVTAEKILNGAVGSLQIAGSAVTADKIAVGVVSRSHIADGAINTLQITNSAVTADKIADGTITSGKISTVDANTITNLTSLAMPVGTINLTNLPTPLGTNYILLSSYNSLSWTQAPLADIIYAGVTETNSGTVGGIVIQKPHSLGRMPYYYRAVFQVTNSIQGYVDGDELDLNSFNWSNVTYRVSFFASSCTATSVTIRADANFYFPGTPRIVVPHGTTGTEALVGGNTFPTNFGQFKFYVR